MAADMAVELKKHNIATVSLWPGAVLTETIKEVKEGKHGELGAKMVCA
jgi:NAD(P)-dependent dehydrogenase (short-subunit alcohol dehydrogenase family)